MGVSQASEGTIAGKAKAVYGMYMPIIEGTPAELPPRSSVKHALAGDVSAVVMRGVVRNPNILHSRLDQGGPWLETLQKHFDVDGIQEKLGDAHVPLRLTDGVRSMGSSAATRLAPEHWLTLEIPTVGSATYYAQPQHRLHDRNYFTYNRPLDIFELQPSDAVWLTRFALHQTSAQPAREAWSFPVRAGLRALQQDQ
jgi:hypothetical protein